LLALLQRQLETHPSLQTTWLFASLAASAASFRFRAASSSAAALCSAAASAFRCCSKPGVIRFRCDSI